MIISITVEILDNFGAMDDVGTFENEKVKCQYHWLCMPRQHATDRFKDIPFRFIDTTGTFKDIPFRLLGIEGIEDELSGCKTLKKSVAHFYAGLKEAEINLLTIMTRVQVLVLPAL